jgi:5'-methylthioadenosine phosphorylase
MAHVTDYDVWHEEPVNVAMVMSTMQKNLKLAQEAVRNLAAKLDVDQECDCDTALANALVTSKIHISKTQRKKLGLLLDKYIKKP